MSSRLLYCQSRKSCFSFSRFNHIGDQKPKRWLTLWFYTGNWTWTGHRCFWVGSEISTVHLHIRDNTFKLMIFLAACAMSSSMTGNWIQIQPKNPLAFLTAVLDVASVLMVCAKMAVNVWITGLITFASARQVTAAGIVKKVGFVFNTYPFSLPLDRSKGELTFTKNWKLIKSKMHYCYSQSFGKLQIQQSRTPFTQGAFISNGLAYAAVVYISY